LEAERVAAEHDRAIAVPRIHSPEVLGRVAEQLTTLAGRFATPPNERAAEAVESLAWLSKLAAGERPFYKIRRSEPVIAAALYSSTTVAPAIAVLSNFSSPGAQRALVNFASLRTLQVEHRASAAEAFRQNVATHGLLLTSQEIVRQYDRYNASQTADADTQRILGALLDVIEFRRDGAADAELPLAPQP
jgi:hypothetical protein